MKKVAIHSLGCKVNSYEADMMRKKLSENGYVIVPFDQKADVYIINTCSVTNIADRKTRQFLSRAKASNPDALVVAAGCYVDTRGAEEVLGGNADIAVTNSEKADIAKILDEYFKETEPACAAGDKAPVHTRKIIKCQDGCNMFCSYCIIPYARGRIKSRRIEDILDEIRGCCAEGFAEFVLTGIHICSYGLDRPDDGEDLPGLIKAVSGIEGVKRIRLGSLEPKIVTEDFVSALSGIDRLCPHFHLSLQSGSDSVLKRMNRHYTTQEYLQGVELLRKAFDRCAITTDIITGFPGETEEEFRETVEFVKKARFYETHIFKYSRRQGTVADRMEGQLPDRIKAERSAVLMDINKENKERFIDSFRDGTVCGMLTEEEVLIEGKRYMTGFTGEYIRCAVPATEGIKPNTFVYGAIGDALNEDMVLLKETNVIK
ncbi:MAG: tRNA (N(6)-L-threonylcarbamoyladenosine(37)-C(2))-methylthiotransferase MtaB [Lachnospiraceae bacterium]|nr:tRNA (N(6)-L-threonylcarbamoyladenosine(37)-C(2))-methylthiotransferase MtaB [Lachnospiraceae bacterium]